MAQSVVGFIIRIWLEFIIAYAAAHWSQLRVVVNSQPRLLLHQRKFVHDAMRRQLRSIAGYIQNSPDNMADWIENP